MGVGVTGGGTQEKPVALAWVARDLNLQSGRSFFCPKVHFKYDDDAWKNMIGGDYSTRIRSGYSLNAGLQYLKPGDTPTLESGAKLTLGQIDERAISTDVLNWYIPHEQKTVTAFSDGHVKALISNFMQHDGIGNNASDWSQLWNDMDSQF